MKAVCVIFLSTALLAQSDSRSRPGGARQVSFEGAGTATISTGGESGSGPRPVALSRTGVQDVAVTLNPVAAAITNTSVLPLTAALTNTANNIVTWSVDGIANGSSSVGTINVTGANTASYRPPTSDGPHRVTASSVASPTASASMVVTVTNYPGTFTYHNDNARDGQNQQEIVLNPSNVKVAQFGKLFSDAVDGQVYAQPLYVANVNIPGQGFHNVLYVATENDSVYAFDADGPTTTPLWQVSFLSAAQNITTVPNTAINANYDDLYPQIGITGTPVIDPSAGTLFVVAKTDDNGTFRQRLHALNIATGEEQANSPVEIKASITTTDPATGKPITKTFSPLLENQRPALLLLNGVVYIAWGSHGDIGTYHGWVMGYSETTLAQVSAYITTPVDSYGGIWQAGGGPAADASGNIYVTSGNGPDDVATGGSDYSGALIKLGTTSGLTVADYFKPSTNTTQNGYEMSSGGPVVLPTQTGSFPDVVIVAGKDKNLYLVNRDSMGGASPSGTQLLQTITNAFRGGVFSTPSVWQNNVYFWAETDVLRSFQLQNGQLSATATYPLNMAYPGAGTAVSSNGSQNGILWALDAKGVLHAFDATNVSHELYNSSQAGTRDNAGTPVKFAVPTVANGKVYVGSANQVSGYGLLNQITLASTTTSLASSASPSLQGSSVTLTATVTTHGSLAPTGTVIFIEGATILGKGVLNASCIAIYMTSSLAVGQHSITAVYGGDTNNNGSTSLTLNLTVNSAAFALAASPASAIVNAGSPVKFTLTVSPSGSYTSPIKFSCMSGLPAQAGCTFNPNSVIPNESPVTTTLTITTAVHTAYVAPSFDYRRSPLFALWLLMPAMLLSAAGVATDSRRKLLICCTVFLLISGCLLQVACGSGNTSSVTAGNGSGTGNGSAGGTSAGTYRITIAGTGGSDQQTLTVTLTVQ
jgi:hypothetical protein